MPFCHVCGRGFASVSERAIHLAEHPGRTKHEIAAAKSARLAEAQKQRRAKQDKRTNEE